MRISLSEVINLKGRSSEYSFETQSEIDYMGTVYNYGTVQPVSLKAYAVGDRSVVVEGSISLCLKLFCDRCLAGVDYPLETSFKRKFEIDSDGTACLTDDEEKVSYIDDYELDIDGLVAEEVMIGFPMKVLCSDDCRGICTKCGANLNKGECGCDRTELDPRMSIIKDLFYQKEV